MTELLTIFAHTNTMIHKNEQSWNLKRKKPKRYLSRATTKDKIESRHQTETIKL